VDTLLPSVLGAVPQLGGAGLLVVIVVLLLRREGAELTRVRTAHDTEMERTRKAHDEDLAEKNEEIDRLQRRLRSADEEIDVLRQRLAREPGRHRWDA
jgi:predicted metalloprotease